jgi:hypothetical protein
MGGLGHIALVVQEGKEALHHAKAGRDRAGSQLLTVGGLDPGIDIRGSRLRQVVIESSLAHFGHENRETFEGTDRGFLHGGGIVAGMQIGQIVGHQTLVPGTEEVQPAELWEFLERWRGL